MKLVAGISVESWTLIQPDPSRPYHWLCRCSCGKEKPVRDSSLKSRKSTSCGHPRILALVDRNTSHGMSRTREYKAWVRMIKRVNSPWYIERGIRVCDRWRESFPNFYADMGPMPAGKRIGVERVNNNGDYEPNNCIWADPTVQNRNKGDTILRRIRSERFDTSKCLTEWAAVLRSHTMNAKWKPRKLKSELDFWGDIDIILQAAGITSLTAQCADDPFQNELVAA